MPREVEMAKLTKVSVLRKLKRQEACQEALAWFQRQPSLAVAWGKLLRYGGPQADNQHVRYRCWVQERLDFHGRGREASKGWAVCSARPATYKEIRQAAIRNGWAR